MSAATSTAAAAPLESDALIEYRRSNESRRLARRATTGFLAVLFLVVAFGALALPAHRALSVQALAATILCYVLCSRVQFEYGGGFAIPTQTVFVVMWFVLPPRLLPLAVCIALVVGLLPDLFRRRMPGERLPPHLPSSWPPRRAAPRP